jgi:hypothetical protein
MTTNESLLALDPRQKAWSAARSKMALSVEASTRADGHPDHRSPAKGDEAHAPGQSDEEFWARACDRATD